MKWTGADEKMEKKKFDPGTEIMGCFQMVKAALMPISDDITKIGMELEKKVIIFMRLF